MTFAPFAATNPALAKTNAIAIIADTKRILYFRPMFANDNMATECD